MASEIPVEIVEQITSQFPAAVVQSTEFQLLALAALIVVTALGVFLAAYLKELGKKYASKEDIEKLLDKTEALTKVTEETKLEVKERFDDRQLGQEHIMHQEMVLLEATRLVARFAEIFKNQPDEAGDFAGDYLKPWNPATVSRTSLEENKRDTCIYRFLRFFSAIERYQNTVTALPAHPKRGFFDFYLTHKIDPVLANDDLPGDYVLWRDAAMELGEVITERSAKWEDTRPISWSMFVEIIQKNDATADFINAYAERISAFIRTKNVRLANFAIILIDLIQDTRNEEPWEDTRNHLLSYIAAKAQPNRFSIWGRTENKENDWEVMDIASGKVPRNIRSPLFKLENNLGYALPKWLIEAKKKQAADEAAETGNGTAETADGSPA
ncbi:hypothetical protein [Nitratireductor sp. XY-223]|uniref:hypothetical protein n=1 Tax=Nitratireductor sp. XY-223 TaxID=2561926 RepID=UPI0010AB28EF|nr:hypothetical protein [Nitratireductor sp. XY-223]